MNSSRTRAWPAIRVRFPSDSRAATSANRRALVALLRLSQGTSPGSGRSVRARELEPRRRQFPADQARPGDRSRLPDRPNGWLGRITATRWQPRTQEASRFSNARAIVRYPAVFGWMFDAPPA